MAEITKENAWEILIGNQTPEEFADGLTANLEAEVGAYLDECPVMFDDPDLWTRESRDVALAGIMEEMEAAGL